MGKSIMELNRNELSTIVDALRLQLKTYEIKVENSKFKMQIAFNKKMLAETESILKRVHEKVSEYYPDES